MSAANNTHKSVVVEINNDAMPKEFKEVAKPKVYTGLKGHRGLKGRRKLNALSELTTRSNLDIRAKHALPNSNIRNNDRKSNTAIPKEQGVPSNVMRNKGNRVPQSA